MEHDSTESLKSTRGAASDRSSERGRARRHYFAVGFVILSLVGAGLWIASWWRLPTTPATMAPPSEDPRLTYKGPFRNIHPETAYVGDDRCSECHQDKALSYRQHPMGRSLFPIAHIAAAQRYDAKTHNPFVALGTLFLVERRGQGVMHRQIGREDKGQVIYEGGMSVDYVLGSGTHGYSYLTDRGGYLFQTPISWYSQKQIWDTSPSFTIELRPGRPINGECLFCHTNRAQPREGYLNRFEEPVFDGYAIGCQRCHGPGARHLENPGRKDGDGVDYTIVNPRHLKPELRAAVCEQCHLAGAGRVVRRGRGLYDFRPGLPLDAFWSVFVAQTKSEGEGREAVGHVEQMYQSQCFLHSRENPAEGKRKLGCTSCHDPHRHVQAEQRVAHYRQRCLECHSEQGCRLPAADRRLKSKDDSCMDCHMPRYSASDIAHTAATDHRILRRAERREPADTGPPRFVSFYSERLDPNDVDFKRDRAVALVQMIAQSKVEPNGMGKEILGLLESAVRRGPDDWEAREAHALALSLFNRPAEALAAYEAILSQAPRREIALAQAAMLAQNQQQYERALSYWKRVVAENPSQASYRAKLAQLLASRNAWDEARPQCAAWLDLDPASIEARTLWVRCLLKTGDKTAARAEFAKIKRLRPSNLPLLEARFAVELRGP